jgi:hypothetical protein
VRGDVPPEIRKSMELWVGCVAGALEDREYVAKLEAAGSTRSISSRRGFTASRTRAEFLAGEGLDVDALAKDVEGRFISGFVRATKPKASSCCGPECCG